MTWPLSVCAVVGIDPLGEAEVSDLGNSVEGVKHIRGFQVAVDNPGFVSDVNRFRQEHRELGRLPRGLGRAGESIGESCPPRAIQGQRTADRLLRRYRRSEEYWDAGAARPPRPRCGSEPTRFARGVTAAADHLQGDETLQAVVVRLVRRPPCRPRRALRARRNPE